MNKQEIKSHLREKFEKNKKGASFYATKFRVPEKQIQEILQEIKEESKIGDQGLHIVLPCVHVPFENKKIILGIQELIKDLGLKLRGFHIIGDFLDMNTLSEHDKGMIGIAGLTLGQEYAAGNELLDKFDSLLHDGVNKSYLFGNHEDRFFRHIKKSDNSKYADALISPTQGLKLKERGYTVKERWKEDSIKLGEHLELIHGEFCSASPARTHLSKYKSSLMFGHTHRVDVCYDGNKASFNIGFLGDKDSKGFAYASRLIRMNWINGFGLVQIDDNNFFHAQVITAFNDEFWYGGKKYGG